jgi:hypothetical protein
LLSRLDVIRDRVGRFCIVAPRKNGEYNKAYCGEKPKIHDIPLQFGCYEQAIERRRVPLSRERASFRQL